LQQSLHAQQLQPADIAFVVAHGNGNQKSDCSEARALRALFAEQAVPVTAFKWAMGHTLCAAGIIDAVLATRALNTQTMPGVANLQTRARDCAHLNVTRETRALPAGARALLISRGFASINASLLLQAYNDQ
jgi:3-oxoacyl-[acyl-carrier-protein] synthase-1